MEVFNNDICGARISSIYLTGTQGLRAVEIGWDEDPAQDPDLAGDCNPTTGQPKAFSLVYDLGSYFCERHGEHSGGDTPNFEVHDHNQNDVWTFVKNGSTVRTYDFGATFNSGDVWAAGERKVEADKNRANIEGFQRMNSSQGWVDMGEGTDTIIEAFDDDNYPPNYEGCPTEPDQWEVLDTC